MSLSPWPVTVTTICLPAHVDALAALEQQPGDPGGGRGLDEDAVAGGQLTLGRRICSSVTFRNSPPDSPRAATASFQDAGLPMRIAEARVSGLGTGAPSTSGAAPAACHAAHHRLAGRVAGVGVLGVAEPVGRDVAGVADREDVDVGSVAEEVDDLEGGGLLALEPHRVHGVHQRDRVVLGEPAGEPQAVVEVAAHHDHLGAVHDRLGELAGGDLALRHQHQRLDAGPGGVGRHRRRGVAGRGADHGLGALADGARTARRSCRGP